MGRYLWSKIEPVVRTPLGLPLNLRCDPHEHDTTVIITVIAA